MLALLVYLVVLGLIYYLVTLLPLPEPFPVVVKIVFVIILILILLSFAGVSFPGTPIFRR